MLVVLRACSRSEPQVTVRSRAAPSDELDRLLELIALLSKGDADARRLADAITTSRLPLALNAGQTDAFRRGMADAARELWPDGAPFSIAWALQAIGAQRAAG
jgi:hypothetical protein